MARGLSLKWLNVIGIVLLFALIGTLFYFQGESQVLRFFEWLEKLGVWAPSLFILIEMVVALCAIPGGRAHLHSRRRIYVWHL